MSNLCDDCKHYGFTVDNFENWEANEGDSNSDSKTNMVRYSQWKRGDDGYLTKLMVEADADEALGLWQAMVKTMKEHIHHTWKNLKRFATFQIVWPWRKFWFTSIVAKTTNQSIRTKSREHISATNHSAFSSHARIIKMVDCQSQLPPRRVISRELHRYCMPVNSSPIHWKNSTNKSKLCIL